MTDSKLPLAEFLAECAEYFRKRPTNGEDKAYWANVYNAENCEKAEASYRQLYEALVQARGALLLEAMVDDDGRPFGTTSVALNDVEAAIAAAEGEQS